MVNLEPVELIGMVVNGIMTIDEARDALGLEPLPKEEGA